MKSLLRFSLLAFLGLSSCYFSGIEKENPSLPPTPVEYQSTATPPLQLPTSSSSHLLVTSTLETLATDTSTPSPTETAIILNTYPSLTKAIISTSDVYNSGEEFLFYDFLTPALWESDETNELQESCLLDCVKKILHGRRQALTISLIRAGDADKAIHTQESIYSDFMRLSSPFEYSDESKWVNAPPENTWIIATSSDDYNLGTSYGSIVILLWLHSPDTDDGYTHVRIISAFANLQLNKLKQAGFPP